MSKSPITPKGTRDFSPSEMIRREYLFNTIREVFQRYGFLPIETPAMETLDTLTGKYGDEGDRLIFRTFNSGDLRKNAMTLDDKLIEKEKEKLRDDNYITKVKTKYLQWFYNKITDETSAKALRYDLTVPFARYVVQHQNDITFPFKRYQIQPVWRADRPQKARYREFYQCDVDVIGSDSLLNEVELIQIIDEVFRKLKIPGIRIKISNRKVLSGIVESYQAKDKFTEFVTILDKYDKIGKGSVLIELEKIGINIHNTTELSGLMFQTASEETLMGDFQRKLIQLKKMLKSSSIGLKGVEEIESIFNYINELGIEHVSFDPTLARGLDYYTGTIIEVTTKDFPGSICAGGRYDDLTGVFGLPGISGVGISFGADRIYDVLSERNLFPGLTGATTQLMFVNFGEKEERYCMKLLAEVRKAGINAEIYPSAVKMKKQMSYANAKSIPYVVLVGSEEMQSGKLTLKNMDSGGQEKLNIEKLIEKLNT